MSEIVKKDNPWTTIPVRSSVKLRMYGFKTLKPNRQKREHVVETLEDVVVRLMDYWDDGHKE